MQKRKERNERKWLNKFSQYVFLISGIGFWEIIIYSQGISLYFSNLTRRFLHHKYGWNPQLVGYISLITTFIPFWIVCVCIGFLSSFCFSLKDKEIYSVLIIFVLFEKLLYTLYLKGDIHFLNMRYFLIDILVYALIGFLSLRLGLKLGKKKFK